MTDKDNQEFLKKLDKFDQTGKRITSRIVIILYAVFTLCILAAVVYYAVGEFQGNGNAEQLTICCVVLLVLAAIPVLNKMVDLLLEKLNQKNNSFDPAALVLPAQGTISLEDALHRMSTQTGVIAWDSIWGCILFSLLFMLVFVNGNLPRILFFCVCITVILAVGHGIFYFVWKKRSFKEKMVRNTSKYMTLACPSEFAGVVEKSLKRTVLCYEKELILTDEFILGSAQWDTRFIPVAVPREQIGELVFYYQRVVNGRYSRYIGTLSCRTGGNKPVELILGTPAKTERILKILDYNHIPWRKEKITYV